MKAALMLMIVVAATACSARPEWAEKYKAEAQVQSIKYWTASFKKCGDRYVSAYRTLGQGDGRIVEIKELRAKSAPDYDYTMSDSDKASGLEWAGNTDLLPNSFRVFENNRWSDWRDGARFTTDFKDAGSVPIRRVSGEWRAGRGGAPHFEAPLCDQIPPE